MFVLNNVSEQLKKSFTLALDEANEVLANRWLYNDREVRNAELFLDEDYQSIRYDKRDFSNPIQNHLFELSFVHLNDQTELIH